MKSHQKPAWVKALPVSRLQYPDTLGNQLKYLFWRLIAPLHPYIRDLLAYMRVLRHEGRQNYLLGKLAPGETLEGFVEYLLEKGFANHFIALSDEGQVVSLRYAPDFKYQYHLRIFEDGEVRGHYEYTPEYKPLKHFAGEGLEARIADFLELLGDRIIPAEDSRHRSFSWALAGWERSTTT